MRAQLLALLFALPLSLSAESVTIRGNDDGPGAKGPLTTVSWERQSDGTLLLIHSEMEDESYREYGVQCTTFLRGEKYLDQISTPALPHGLGGLIADTVAAPPFDLHVVCVSLSPKNTRRTVVPVTVQSQRLVGKVNCTLTLTTGAGTDEEVAETFSASDLTTAQTDADTFTVSFEGSSSDDGETVTVSSSADVSATDSSLTGSLVITREGEAETLEASGSVVITDESLGSFELISSDESATLSCI